MDLLWEAVGPCFLRMGGGGGGGGGGEDLYQNF